MVHFEGEVGSGSPETLTLHQVWAKISGSRLQWICLWKGDADIPTLFGTPMLYSLGHK